MTILTTQIPSKFWPKKFDELRNLIYVPLDMPEPPKVDIDLFLDWVFNKSPRLVGKVNNPETGEKIMHHEERGMKGWGYYPWTQVSAFHHGYSDTWIAEFDKIFPEVVEYIHLFPYNMLAGVSILLQKSSVRVPLHIDTDDWLGMRFFLHNEVKENVLYFHKRKTDENNRVQTYILDNSNDTVKVQDWEKYFHTDKKIYSKHPAPRHAWAMSSSRAVHGLDPFEYEKCSRITFLIHAHRPTIQHNAWNTDKLYDLLIRSLDKYPDYAIWWEAQECL
jgi:hypothetical protein